MTLLRCIIVDDEPLARKGLKEYVDDVDFLDLVAEFDNPLKAISALNENVDLLFLDIQMPKINGIELFKALQHPPPVIFTTAFPQFALQGFEVNALDYLVKPISFDRFYKAALKALEYHEFRNKKPNETQPQSSANYFYIKADNKLVKIIYDDILFIEAMQNYVTIHTTEKKYISYLTFHAIEEYLPSEKFIKCHKSFIVSAAKVSSIEGNELIIGQHHIPISRNSKEDVLEKLLKGRYLKR